MKLTLWINIPGLHHANDIDTCTHGRGISKYILSGWFLCSTCKGFAVHYIALSKRSPFRSLLWVKAQKFQLVRLVHSWLFPVISSYIQLYCYIAVYPVTYSYTYSYRVIYSYIRWYWLALPPWWVLHLLDTLRFSHKQLWFQLWLAYYTLHQVWLVIFDTRTFSPINLGKVIILSNGLGPLSIIRSCD